MADFKQLSPEDLFTRTLQLIKNPDEDFIIRHSVSRDEREFTPLKI
jgi:hypothetical protein